MKGSELREEKEKKKENAVATKCGRKGKNKKKTKGKHIVLRNARDLPS